MAFSLDVTIPDVEYRAMRSGTGKRGLWMSLVWEDKSANQIETSVPAEMQSDVMGLGLSKGDRCVVSIRAVARADGNSYVMLQALPELMDEEE